MTVLYPVLWGIIRRKRRIRNQLAGWITRWACANEGLALGAQGQGQCLPL